MSEEQKKKTTFEQSLARLERIVSEMEGGELSLGDMLKKFEEGRKLRPSPRKSNLWRKGWLRA